MLVLLLLNSSLAFKPMFYDWTVHYSVVKLIWFYSTNPLRYLVLFYTDVLIFLKEEINQYGIDYDGPLPEDANDDTVIVPVVRCPLTTDEIETLVNTIDPLRDDNTYGIAIYEDVLHFVTAILNSYWLLAILLVVITYRHRVLGLPSRCFFY